LCLPGSFLDKTVNPWQIFVQNQPLRVIPTFLQEVKFP
jgi:hypothetical protein